MGKRKTQHLKPVDPFELSDEGYSEDNFYTRATDGAGHKETFHIPVPPRLFAQVQEFVSSRQFPIYRSAQDLVRDAVHHRMYWLTERADDPRFREMFAAFLLRENIAMERARAEENRAAVEELRGGLAEATAGSDEKLKTNIIEYAEDLLDQMPEPYREQIRNVLRQYK